MKFDSKELTTVIADGKFFDIVPGSVVVRPVVDGQPLVDMTGAALMDGRTIIFKDKDVSVLIFGKTLTLDQILARTELNN